MSKWKMTAALIVLLIMLALVTFAAYQRYLGPQNQPVNADLTNAEFFSISSSESSPFLVGGLVTGLGFSSTSNTQIPVRFQMSNSSISANLTVTYPNGATDKISGTNLTIYANAPVMSLSAARAGNFSSQGTTMVGSTLPLNTTAPNAIAFLETSNNTVSADFPGVLEVDTYSIAGEVAPTSPYLMIMQGSSLVFNSTSVAPAPGELKLSIDTPSNLGIQVTQERTFDLELEGWSRLDILPGLNTPVQVAVSSPTGSIATDIGTTNLNGADRLILLGTFEAFVVSVLPSGFGITTNGYASSIMLGSSQLARYSLTTDISNSAPSVTALLAVLGTLGGLPALSKTLRPGPIIEVTDLTLGLRKKDDQFTVGFLVWNRKGFRIWQRIQAADELSYSYSLSTRSGNKVLFSGTVETDVILPPNMNTQVTLLLTRDLKKDEKYDFFLSVSCHGRVVFSKTIAGLKTGE